MPESFIGLPYPLIRTPRGVFSPQSGAIQIQSSLLSILMTTQFERVMENDFGAGLDYLLFEQAGQGVEQAARDRIVNAISQYEPRAVIEELTVSTTPPADNLLIIGDPGVTFGQILYIRLKYRDPENITEVQDLTLELPIGAA